MAHYVSLSEPDRQRFDTKEWLSIALADITVADLEELSERFEFDIDDWPTPFLGEVAFEDAGREDAPVRRPRWYSRALVWMALRQNGHDVTWDECGTVQVLRVRFKSDEEPEESGKDTSPSGTSDATTTTPSGSSST